MRGDIGNHGRVRLIEVVAQVAVEDGGADLEEAVGGSVRPGHLLFLDEVLGDDLVDAGFDEPCRNENAALDRRAGAPVARN